MNLYELLKHRRMVRNYRPEPVAAEALERILKASQKGPSAGFSQGVTLVVVEDPQRRRAIAQLAQEDRWVAKGFNPWLSVAPVHLVLCAEPEIYLRRYAKPDKRDSRLAPGKSQQEIPYWYLDAGAALMAILLAAVEENLAAGFQGGHNVPGLPALLNIPNDVEVLGVITLGHPAPDRKSGSLEQGRRPQARAIHRETWIPAES